MTSCGLRRKRRSRNSISSCTTRVERQSAAWMEAPTPASSAWPGICDIRLQKSAHIPTTMTTTSPTPDSRGPSFCSGNYSARMFEKVGGVVTEVAGPQSFKVVTEGTASLSAADLRSPGTVLAEGGAAISCGVGRRANRR